MLRPMSAVLERSIGVRPSGAGDGAFIEALATLAFGEFDPDSGPHTWALTQKRGVRTLIATRPGAPIGFIVLEAAPEATHVQAIAVAPSERGRGIGATLMAAAVRWARAAGSAQLRLITAQANVEALELFLKNGFAIERQLPRFYARGQDACVLSRRL
jgi:ribosomal protein S18 acetylase RimI-like enzyme